MFDYLLVSDLVKNKNRWVSSPRRDNMEIHRENTQKLKSELRNNFQGMVNELPFLSQQDSHGNSGSDWRTGRGGQKFNDKFDQSIMGKSTH